MREITYVGDIYDPDLLITPIRMVVVKQYEADDKETNGVEEKFELIFPAAGDNKSNFFAEVKDLSIEDCHHN
jgi:hypothetical protein